MVAHEVGHWIQGRLNLEQGGDILWSYNYNYSPQDADCDFFAIGGETPWTPANSLNSHGIRSAEHSSGAMPEGFAQFIAAAAYNEITADEEGLYRYYKAIEIQANPETSDPYYDFVTNDKYRVAMQGGGIGAPGGQTAWVENMCEDDFDYPQQTETMGQEVTTELDWMRFFWALIAADEGEYGTAMTFWDVAHLLAYTNATEPWGFTGSLYCNLLDALNDAGSGLNSFEDRFIDLTAVHGVFYDDPTSCP